MKIAIIHTIILLFFVAIVGRANSAEFALEVRPIQEALLANANGDTLEVSNLPAVIRAKEKGNIDLLKVTDPFLAINLNDGFLYYQFYNNILPINTQDEYVVQRVKKTIHNYECGSDEPEVEVTYLVEAFQLSEHRLNNDDDQYGHFHYYFYCKREVIKEYETGIAKIESLVNDPSWPFARKNITGGYVDSPELFNKVEFKAKEKWNINLVVSKDGNYNFKVSAKNFELIKTNP